MKECTPDKCNADCCRYAAIVIDPPASKTDFEEIRWLVAHENTFVYKDNEGDWILEFKTPCKYLNNMRCDDYDNRPAICREHDPEDCVANETGSAVEEILFSEPADVERYIAARWPKKAKRTRKTVRQI